jgi:hypothetical protein
VIIDDQEDYQLIYKNEYVDKDFRELIVVLNQDDYHLYIVFQEY